MQTNLPGAEHKGLGPSWQPHFPSPSPPGKSRWAGKVIQGARHPGHPYAPGVSLLQNDIVPMTMVLRLL